MRFEFNSDDVVTLVDMFYDLVETIRVGGMNINSKRVYLTRIKRMIYKVKTYGLQAFENRDIYRQTIIDMKTAWDIAHG